MPNYQITLEYGSQYDTKVVGIRSVSVNVDAENELQAMIKAKAMLEGLCDPLPELTRVNIHQQK